MSCNGRSVQAEEGIQRYCWRGENNFRLAEPTLKLFVKLFSFWSCRNGAKSKF